MARQTARARNEAAARPARGAGAGVPLKAETLPRFAPSPRALGEAYAEEILEAFRKDLASVDLRTAAKAHHGGQRHKQAQA